MRTSAWMWVDAATANEDIELRSNVVCLWSLSPDSHPANPATRCSHFAHGKPGRICPSLFQQLQEQQRHMRLLNS